MRRGDRGGTRSGKPVTRVAIIYRAGAEPWPEMPLVSRVRSSGIPLKPQETGSTV